MLPPHNNNVTLFPNTSSEVYLFTSPKGKANNVSRFFGRGGMLGTPKAHCIRFGEPHALLPLGNDVALLLQRCAEDVAPYKLTFNISLVGEGFPLPLGNDVTLQITVGAKKQQTHLRLLFEIPIIQEDTLLRLPLHP